MLSNLRRRDVVLDMRRELAPLLMRLRRFYLNRFWGMDIGRDCTVSFSAKLDLSNPRGIHIGAGTRVDFEVHILTHDYVGHQYMDIWIGKNCHLGARSVIFPGVKIGDNCIVEVASVVMNDVPPNCLVSGHPARVIEKGIQTGRWGIVNRIVRPDFGRASVKSEDKIAE